MNAKQLRSSPRWKRARLVALRGATHCDICHEPLDFAAPPRSSRAPSVDHIIPLALGGAPFDQANLRPVHLGCNSSRKAGTTPRRVVSLAPPESWLREPRRRSRWW